MLKLSLDFYGVSVAISGDQSQIIGNLRDRFKFFHRSSLDDKADVTISFKKENKDLRTFEARKTIGVSPRNYYFQYRHLLFADYFGKAFSIYNLKSNSFEVYSEIDDMIYEIIYLFILSQVGTLLEKKGIYRTHGIAFESLGLGYLILLPSGGGKSSLALRLLERTSANIVSEDSPLIGPGNKMHSLPLGIGVDPDKLGFKVPDKDIFSYYRMEFAKKKIILPNYYLNRIAKDPVALNFVIIGKRSLGSEAKIVRCGSFALMKTLTKKMVIGLGLFQGIEFLLHRYRLLRLRMILLLIKRFIKAMRINIGTRKYIFYMGYDYDKNFRTLTEFLDQRD